MTPSLRTPNAGHMCLYKRVSMGGGGGGVWENAPSESIEIRVSKIRARGATLKVGGGGGGGGLNSDSKWGGWKHLFLSNSLKFPKKWGGWSPPLPLPPPRALKMAISCILRRIPCLSATVRWGIERVIPSVETSYLRWKTFYSQFV